MSKALCWGSGGRGWVGHMFDVYNTTRNMRIAHCGD